MDFQTLTAAVGLCLWGLSFALSLLAAAKARSLWRAFSRDSQAARERQDARLNSTLQGLQELLGSVRAHLDDQRAARTAMDAAREQLQELSALTASEWMGRREEADKLTVLAEKQVVEVGRQAAQVEAVAQQATAEMLRVSGGLESLITQLHEHDVRLASAEADHRAVSTSYTAARGDFLQAAATLAEWHKTAERASVDATRAAAEQSRIASLVAADYAGYQKVLAGVEAATEAYKAAEARLTATAALHEAAGNDRAREMYRVLREHAQGGVAFAEQQSDRGEKVGAPAAAAESKRLLAIQFAEQNLAALGYALSAEQQQALRWWIEAEVQIAKQAAPGGA